MQRIFFIVFSVCVLASVSAQNIDVLHYKYNIELSDINDTVYGKAEISFVVKRSIGEVEFDLTGGAGAKKGMLVTKVSMPYGAPNGNTTMTNTYSQFKDKLNIKAWRQVAAGDSLKVTIEYKGVPEDGLIISKNKYGSRTFFSDNWPNRAHRWIPCIDDPADKASVEFIVMAPSHYQVISNGVLVEETNLQGNKTLTHWSEDTPLPTKVMVIGVADFAVNNIGSVNCIPVSSWVFPENKNDGFYDYAPAKDILSFFMNYIGPYGYKKLANVQSKTIFGGMENASAIFYSENSVTGSRQAESLLAHEIAHQWFGNMATEKSFAHLWLSEGFATYFTHIYIESKYGTDSLNKEMSSEREEIIGFVKNTHRPVIDSTTNYMQLLNINSYQKGSWVLHMLRRQLGDSVFRKSIRKYYETYAGKNADSDDLRKIFESVSGKDLEKFFSQWLLSPVNPILKINWTYLSNEKKIKVDMEQMQGETSFTMPLDIELRLPAGKKIMMPLNITGKSQSFNLSVAEKPLQLIADPHTSLLFEGKVTEVK